MNRYFTHAEKFQDDTAYIVISPKRPYVMDHSGKRILFHSRDRARELGRALDAVARGAWKEVTAKEAKAMVQTTVSPRTKT